MAPSSSRRRSPPAPPRRAIEPGWRGPAVFSAFDAEKSDATNRRKSAGSPSGPKASIAATRTGSCWLAASSSSTAGRAAASPRSARALSNPTWESGGNFGSWAANCRVAACPLASLRTCSSPTARRSLSFSPSRLTTRATRSAPASSAACALPAQTARSGQSPPQRRECPTAADDCRGHQEDCKVECRRRLRSPTDNANYGRSAIGVASYIPRHRCLARHGPSRRKNNVGTAP